MDNIKQARKEKRELLREAYRRGLMHGKVYPVNSHTPLGVNITEGEFLQPIYNPVFNSLFLLVGADEYPWVVVIYKQGKWATKQFPGHQTTDKQ